MPAHATGRTTPPRGCRSSVGIDFRTEASHADCAIQVSLPVWGRGCREAGSAGLMMAGGKTLRSLVLSHESSLESSVRRPHRVANASSGPGVAARS